MSAVDGIVFTVVFVAFFVLRAVIATVVFFYVLHDDDSCPNCDSPTLRLESRGLLRWLPALRPSWCYECEWHGLLRSSGRKPSRTAAARAASFH